MDNVIYKLRLEATKPGRQATIYVRKNDTNTRFIEATITSSGKTLELGNALVTLNATVGSTPYHVAGSVNDDGVTAHIELPNGLIATPGEFEAELRVDDTAHGKVLTSARLAVIVEDILYDDQSEEAQEALDALAQYAQDAEAYAKGTRGGVAVEEGDEGYHDNSKYYRDLAEDYAGDAYNDALAAEGWAKGTHNGEPVGSTDPSYENNAKFYAEAAATSEQNAEGAADDALDYKIDAQTAEGNASEYANTASRAADGAVAAKEAIENLGVTASTLSPGSSASVTKTVDPETGAVTLGFGIPKGADGEDGYSPSASVSKSGNTATISITDKTGTTTAEVSDGEDGYSPSASVSKSGGVTTISITDKTGTTTAEVSDGEDGYSPSASVSKTGGVTTITITDKDGTTTAEVLDGENNGVRKVKVNGTELTPDANRDVDVFPELWQYFPTKTAATETAGDVLTLEDAADARVKSMTVTLPESETAYGKVYVVRSGKNLCNLGVRDEQGHYVLADQGNSTNLKVCNSGIFPAGYYALSLIVPPRVDGEEDSNFAVIRFRVARGLNIFSDNAAIVFARPAKNEPPARLSAVIEATNWFDRLYFVAGDNWVATGDHKVTLKDIQLERVESSSGTATDYEAFRGAVYERDLTGEGVYGGDVDFTAGAATQRKECNLIPSVGTISVEYLENSVAPRITVESITGGHKITIYDVDHPDGQTFDVMDGSDAAVTAANIIAALGFTPAAKPPNGTITIPANSWSATTDGYAANITSLLPSGSVTNKSQVSLQPSDAVIKQLMTDGCGSLNAANDNGTVYATTVLAAPTVAITVQYTITELA